MKKEQANYINAIVAQLGHGHAKLTELRIARIKKPKNAFINHEVRRITKLIKETEKQLNETLKTWTRGKR